MAALTLELPSAATPPAWFVEADVAADDVIPQLTAALNHKVHRERWKYTRVQPVLELLDKPAAPIDWGELPAGVTLQTLRHDAAIKPAQVFFGDGLAETLACAPEATALMCYQTQVQVLTVTGEVQTPLFIDQTHLQQPVIIRLGENASLDLREGYRGGADTQLQSIWVDMGRGSRLLHSRNSFTNGTHWQFLRVNIAQDATYRLHNHAIGAALRRQDMQLICTAPGAHAEVTSAASIGEKTHLDQQITVEHRAPHTTSQQTFHNIAAAGAKVTFNGRIHIHPHCGSVDANLTNKNLSLGDGAVINTKPELEIYTDDVKCSHGATVGRLDPNHLFYLASRGIPPQQARTLLSQAFLQVCTLGPLAEEAHRILHAHASGDSR